MKLLVENLYYAFLTFDKNLQYQQNFLKYSITVFVLTADINSYAELTSFVAYNRDCRPYRRKDGSRQEYCLVLLSNLASIFWKNN